MVEDWRREPSPERLDEWDRERRRTLVWMQLLSESYDSTRWPVMGFRLRWDST